MKITLTNKSLELFINKVNLDKEEKERLLEKLPKMTEKERESLYKLLKELYLFDIEEEEFLKKFN